MQIPEFLFVLDFNNFLLTNARDRRKINSDRYRFQFDVILGVEIFVWGGGAAQMLFLLIIKTINLWYKNETVTFEDANFI